MTDNELDELPTITGRGDLRASDGNEEARMPLAGHRKRHPRKKTLKHYFTSEGLHEMAAAAKQEVLYPMGRPLLGEIKHNLKSGVTVSLVSVPLSISLAIAGGATPAMGIVTAFWSGLFAAILGGSHFNIVGPTGALSGVLANSVIHYGLASLPLLAILAGVFSFLVWLFKLDKYIMYIPGSVIHGFTVGVAFIIGLNQLNYALGITGLPVHGEFYMNVGETFYHIGEARWFSILFFAVNLVTLVMLVRKWPTIPWAIVIASFGILFGYLVTLGIIPVHLVTLQKRFGDLKLSLVSFPDFGSVSWDSGVISNTIGVAFIAILETLISARIADGMTKTKHDQPREVLSVAIANIVCGLMGGIPATAALARTALNIKSGGSSRVSGVINAISVLLISLVFLPLFKYIPMPTVAALLVMIAMRMVAIEHFAHMWNYDKTTFITGMLSGIFCILIDTMAGIVIGAVISIMIFVDSNSSGHAEVQVHQNSECIGDLDIDIVDQDKQLEGQSVLAYTDFFNDSVATNADIHGNTLIYRLIGQLTFVNATQHVDRISKIVADKNIKNVVISLRYLPYVDLDGIDGLKEMITDLDRHEVQVLFCGVLHNTLKSLSAHEFFVRKQNDGLVFSTFHDALTHLSSQP